MDLNQIKRIVWDKIYEEEGVVSFVVDTENCDLPESVKTLPHAFLNIGRDMTPPIPDLWVDDKGICATLSFNGEGFPVSIPWDSVFSIDVPQKGVVTKVLFANVIIGKPAKE